ncbi:MAG: hypothetical protein DHS20C18_11890 [Saprospiraceae bacterium]|nr:MAG: hypothetical protein DHS20C18_11890 [Saprospiraceae bacterium]
MASKKKSGFSFPINFEKETPEKIELRILAYDRDGNLLEEGKFDGKNAHLSLPEEQLADARIFIAPESGKIQRIAEPSIEYLEKIRAYEPIIRRNLDQQIDILPIPESLSKVWWWVICRVKGRLVKWFLIDGNWELKPICNAKVHICEVDRIYWIIKQIPDNIIYKFREIFYEEEIRWPEPPGPPPVEIGPIPELRPFSNLQPNVNIANINLTATSNIIQRKKLPAINADIRLQLASPNLDLVRTAIAENFVIFHPYLCFYPIFWPYFYRCDEIKTVVTDSQGRFDTNISYQLFGDKPDLYFWAEKSINGTPTTIYRPHIACYTHWNYTCGKEVTLYSNHPSVKPGCPPVLAGSIAWVQTIGNHASVADIQQTNAFTNIQGKLFNTIGLTAFRTNELASFGLNGTKVRPFARGLHFRVMFGNGTGPGHTISKFLWSYRRTATDKLLNSSAGDKVWTPLNGVSLRKSYLVPNAAGTDFDRKYYDMGPQPDGKYLIPPYFATSIEPNAVWEDAETVTASFNSDTLKGDGLYEFKLEVFNSAGTLQTVAKDFYRVNGGSGSVAAPVEFFNPVFPGSFTPFRMRVRIDNQKCTALVEDVTVDGNISSSECGFVKYVSKATSDVNLRFKASQPNDFGVFRFTVNRGKGNPTPATDRGSVINDTAKYNLHEGPLSPIDTADGYFHGAFNVGSMLGHCTKAAFAEYLYVDGLHTDGNVVLDHFDANFLAAFALEPTT